MQLCKRWVWNIKWQLNYVILIDAFASIVWVGIIAASMICALQSQSVVSKKKENIILQYHIYTERRAGRIEGDKDCTNIKYYTPQK